MKIGLLRRLRDERGQADWIEYSLELVMFLILGTAAWAVFMAARDQLMLNHAASMAISSERVYGCYTNVANEDLQTFFESQGMPPNDIQVEANPTAVPAPWGEQVAAKVSADIAMPVFGWSGWTMELGASQADVAQPVSALPNGVTCEAPTMNANVTASTSPQAQMATASQPEISGVSFSDVGPNMEISVSGYGFGNEPQSMPYSGDLGVFVLQDQTQGGWNAGNTGNAVTLNYTSWDPYSIQISGFSGAYGGGWVVQPGDTVVIKVTNPQSGDSTTWTGQLP